MSKETCIYDLHVQIKLLRFIRAWAAVILHIRTYYLYMVLLVHVTTMYIRTYYLHMTLMFCRAKQTYMCK